jgi:hypothetical protein
MEKKRIKPMFSLVLTIVFLAACSSPSNAPAAPQTTQTQPAPTDATTPATAEAGVPSTEEGLCTNTYYPVRQGATWNYKSTGSPAGGYSFTDTISAVRNDGFTLSTQSGDLTHTQEWACRPEGLVALQFGGAPAALLDAQSVHLKMQAGNVSGVTFPSQIKAGDQWQHTLDLQGDVTVGAHTGTAKGSAQTNFKALGNESVTVPAGTFDALKIQADTTLKMDVSYQGFSLPVTFSGSYIYWFAPGVGWVKASGTGNAEGTSFSETIELQSYRVP